MPSGTLPTPIGVIHLRADADRLVSLTIGAPGGTDDDPSPLIREALAQLRAYFDRRLVAFDLPYAPPRSARGLVLRDAIAAIPPGRTLSYGALAALAGSSPRAIGQACARNPLPILIPCHRVLASGGGIGHYSAGSGTATKRWLLDHERMEIDDG